MSVQVENLEKNMAKLTIEVAAEEVEKAIQAAYLKEKGKISMPGFRKGKVPRKMIEKMYGEAVFYEDAANTLIQENYPAAVEESGIDIVSRPTIDVVQIESGKPFIFTAEVAVRPEVKLGKYLGVQVTKIDTSVSDEEVEAAVEKERNNNARTVTVTDRPIANGDTAVIDFEGFVDGVAFEGGKGENHPLEIGSHSFIDTFEDQLVGKNAGDEVEVNVTFPEKYQAADLAGKPAMFKVKIHEVKCKELPELNDEFAQDVPATLMTRHLTAALVQSAGNGYFLQKGFEDQLIGKKKGETCDVNVTKEDHADELAGKEVRCNHPPVGKRSRRNDEFARHSI